MDCLYYVTKLKNDFKLYAGQWHCCGNTETISLLTSGKFKLSENPRHWRIAMSNSKKKGGEDKQGKEILCCQPLQKSYLMKLPTKILLSIKLTYFHLVQRNATLTSNTKWTRVATPGSQKEKEGFGHVIGQNKNAVGQGYQYFHFMSSLSPSFYCMKMLNASI